MAPRAGGRRRILALAAALAVAGLVRAATRSPEPPTLPHAEPGAVLDVLQARSVGALSGLAAGPDGTLYLTVDVAAAGGGRVVAVPRRGDRRSLLPAGGAGPLALDRDGTLYTVDSRSLLLALGPGGGPRTVTSLAAATASDQVRYLAAGSGTGDVYVAGARTVQRVDPEGRVTPVAGTRAAAAVAGPSGQAETARQVPDGSAAGDARFDSIRGLGYDPGSGALYVLDQGVLFRIDAQGRIGAVDRDASGSPHYFEGSGLAVDRRSGDVYLLDGATNRLARVGRDGSVRIVPGTDGVLDPAVELALDAEGNLYLRTPEAVRMLGAPAAPATDSGPH